MNDSPVAATEALLLFAHGSSDPEWAEPFVRLQAAMKKRASGMIIELAFLERMQPSFDEAVAALQARGVRQITIAPIFLALGGHMKKDLPMLIDRAGQRTGIAFRALPAIGEVDILLDAIAGWVLGAKS